jgi:hypothetical protein
LGGVATKWGDWFRLFVEGTGWVKTAQAVVLMALPVGAGGDVLGAVAEPRSLVVTSYQSSFPDWPRESTTQPVYLNATQAGSAADSAVRKEPGPRWTVVGGRREPLSNFREQLPVRILEPTGQVSRPADLVGVDARVSGVEAVLSPYWSRYRYPSG